MDGNASASRGPVEPQSRVRDRVCLASVSVRLRSCDVRLANTTCSVLSTALLPDLGGMGLCRCCAGPLVAPSRVFRTTEESSLWLSHRRNRTTLRQTLATAAATGSRHSARTAAPQVCGCCGSERTSWVMWWSLRLPAGRHVRDWPAIPVAVACPDPRVRAALCDHLGVVKRDYPALGRTAIAELLDQEHAVVWSEVEAKLTDRRWPTLPAGVMRIDPHHLSTARHDLLDSGVIRAETNTTRGGRRITVYQPTDTHRRTRATTDAAARKRLLEARYLGWASGTKEAGEGIIGRSRPAAPQRCGHRSPRRRWCRNVWPTGLPPGPQPSSPRPRGTAGGRWRRRHPAPRTG